MPQREPSGFPAGIAVLISLFAVGLGVVAVGVAATDDGGGDGGGGGGASTGAAVGVELADFSISPEPIEVASGGSLAVTNAGNTVHNLAVRDEAPATDDLQPGSSQDLPLTDLAEGSYTVYCTIAGHAEAGMEASMVVGPAGTETATGDTAVDHSAHDGQGTEEDWARLDQAMHDSMLEFPAETEGVGNQPLEPTEVTADGTKVFDLTVAITDWEVEPGRVVQAYSYNGQVPGPWIKVNTGDHVQIRVTNDLPMGTDVHMHGIDVPNEMDGVAPITQDLIQPNGGTFTYEFTAERQSLGMYHAHHHGQMQVPNGLFGMFQIDDLPLPLGQTVSGVTLPDDIDIAQEIPMVVNDAGVIGLSLNGKSFPATAPIVMEKDEWGLVHYQNEGLQVHPMHMHGFRQLVVAKDGVPLDQPYWVDTLNVAPGERYSILFQADRVGTWVWHCHILNHVEREEGMFGMVTALVVQDPAADTAPTTEPAAGT
jgi:FtsP/CotA-like multicopper oxidase with cupredoxin domain